MKNKRTVNYVVLKEIFKCLFLFYFNILLIKPLYIKNIPPKLFKALFLLKLIKQIVKFSQNMIILKIFWFSEIGFKWF